MNSSTSRTCVQEASLLSRTPSAAETVRPEAQTPGKPASSTIFAERPSWASMRNVSSGARSRVRNRAAFDAGARENSVEPGGGVVIMGYDLPRRARPARDGGATDEDTPRPPAQTAAVQAAQWVRVDAVFATSRPCSAARRQPAA